MTPEEIIAAGVEAHRELDAALTKARRAALTIEELTEAGAAAGLAKPLASKAMINAAREVTGAIATVGRMSAELHQRQTKVAREREIDTGSLSVVAGVDMPITTMGGGDR